MSCLNVQGRKNKKNQAFERINKNSMTSNITNKFNKNKKIIGEINLIF